MRILNLLLILSLLSCGQKSEFSLNPEATYLNYNPLFNNKVDILLVIDNSSSMLQHQQALLDSAPDLIFKLKEKDFDFQLGATSTDISSNGDRGRLIGLPSFLVKSTPDINTRLREKLLLGANGSNVEKGLESMRLSLSAPLTQEDNIGFLRPDAFLLIIVLSNENDQSEQLAQSYIDFLDRIKPSTPTRSRNWMMHFIGVTGEVGENCQTFGNYRDIGTKYMQLSQYSGGISSTICALNFKYVLSNVESALLTLLTEIPLSRIPIVDSIRIAFNGTPVPNDGVDGWTYNSLKNSILFHGNYVPRTQTRIDIYFDPKDPK